MPGDEFWSEMDSGWKRAYYVGDEYQGEWYAPAYRRRTTPPNAAPVQSQGGSVGDVAETVDVALLETVRTLLGKNEAGRNSILCQNLRAIFRADEEARRAELPSQPQPPVPGELSRAILALRPATPSDFDTDDWDACAMTFELGCKATREAAAELAATTDAKLAEYERVCADPVAVHASMMHGTIAMPSRMNLLHLAGATDYDTIKEQVATTEAEMARLREAVAIMDAALRAHNDWHSKQDDANDYADSYLCDQNLKALVAGRKATHQPATGEEGQG